MSGKKSPEKVQGATRAQFATKLGVIAATVGSAVGLGNIWRFPYEAGEHGGGAFLLINALFVVLLGIPVICAEFVIGRYTGSNVLTAFSRMSTAKLWRSGGVLALLGSELILGFYLVVAGWALAYLWQSVTAYGGATDAAQLHERFSAFISSGWEPWVWMMIFLAMNYVVMRAGVQKGIEKVSNVLMPLLFLILLCFCINSLTLDGAAEGLTFLFKPDFSRVDSATVLGAMGQAFFSLSLGVGCLITYASYFSARTPLVQTAVVTASLDMLVAILAGVMIFPAVFTFGQTPAAGPTLVFEVLPSIFMHMSGGSIWGTLFFVLLVVASLTSTISLSEIMIAFLTERLGMKRGNATILHTLSVGLLATLCAFSFGPLQNLTIGGMTMFNLFDYLSSNIIMPIGGMLTSVYVGWVMKREIVRAELEGAEPGRGLKIAARSIVFCLRYIAPACILLVFLYGLGLLEIG